MKKKKVDSLTQKLQEVIHGELKRNKSEITNKIEKVIKKSIKRIVKKADKQAKQIYG